MDDVIIFERCKGLLTVTMLFFYPSLSYSTFLQTLNKFVATMYIYIDHFEQISTEEEGAFKSN